MRTALSLVFSSLMEQPAPPFPSLAIGPVQLHSALLLAPLAGYTDLPFRLLCKEKGAGLCCSEMISCHGLLYAQKNTYELLNTVPDERPFAVQLFGNEPELMARAAAIVSTLPVHLIDINMGCPVRKVVKKGCGAALMNDPKRAEAIIRAVRSGTSLPVTVKFRSGWTHKTINAPAFARMAESAGAAAVTIHARTWAQGFGGEADRGVIAAVKSAVSIPVIGNGDVRSCTQARAMMAETGCDGVMVGRGALGHPWLFSLEDKPAMLAARMPVIVRYLQLAEHFLPLDKVLFKVKNHTAQFLNGITGASSLRRTLYRCDSITDLREILYQYAQQGSTDAHLLRNSQ